MSRCFPYPPPGYTLSKTKIEALIKLENERQKIKELKRKEKRENRRHGTKKRKEKKHVSNGFLYEPCVLNGHANRKTLAEDKSILERNDFENEQFYESSLTEEHGSSISHSSSSDNSNTGIKSKGPFSHNYGKEFVKQNHVNASDKGQTPCTSSLSKNLSSNLRSHSQRSKKHKHVIKSMAESSKRRSPMQKAAQEYKNLVESWAPPSNLQDSSFHSYDMDWLFDRRENMPPDKRRTFEGEVTTCARSSSSFLQRAEYLPEVNVYALPLTIPF